eukprot:CAMPEP_0194161848 /NCGR_PEP_ID=MMETSP0152-20130528/79166_1 /TAXON_ID=1049557 /ORGANISM="Thalassiothrix antarctica, Strain L6-D1" /LENGTH=604 /DNA_ID=CAMNT_0038871683 /DNA_START=97 /DNA_END=1908 /DNA_ORIENTATION=-
MTKINGYDDNYEKRLLLSQEQQRRRGRRHNPIESRIVGGKDVVEEGKYPFFVSWGSCGASLVSRDVILSAAHCEINRENVVSIGQSRKNTIEGKGVERTIVQKVIHPSYNAWLIDYDYMLIKLNQSIDNIDDFSSSLIELNEDDETSIPNDELTVIGFGATSQFDSIDEYPTILKEVNVSIVPTDECNNYTSYDGEINNVTMFCAGLYPEGGKDACQGDSGGPIFYRQNDNAYVQVGIVSWGLGCAIGKYPGVYSRISGAIDWIKTEICNLSEFKPDYCNTTANNNDDGDNDDTSLPNNYTLPPNNGIDDNNSTTIIDDDAPTDGEDDNNNNSSIIIMDDDDGFISYSDDDDDTAVSNNETNGSIIIIDNDSTINNTNYNDDDDNASKIVPIRLDITYDFYPSETGWSLSSSLGTILLDAKEGDAKEGAGLAQYRILILSGSRVIFTITDKLGDGICCGFGNGQYQIYAEEPRSNTNDVTDNNNDILLASSDGKFGYGETKEFVIPPLINDINNNNNFDDDFTIIVQPTMQPTTLLPTKEEDDFTTVQPTMQPTTVLPIEEDDNNDNNNSNIINNDNNGGYCEDSTTIQFHVDNDIVGKKSCDW